MQAIIRLLPTHGVWAPGVRLLRGLGFAGQVSALVVVATPLLGLLIWQSLQLYQLGLSGWVAPTSIASLSILVIAYLLVSLHRVQRGGTRQLVRALEAWAAGDLSAIPHPHGADDLAVVLSALARAKATFGDIAHELHQAGATLLCETDKLTTDLRELRGESSDISENLQVMTAALTEISSSVNSGSEKAREAAVLALASTTAASRGSSAINDVVGAMTDIRTQSAAMEAIVSTIDAIATRTNLLALNAAVEAARAGERGRGFGVVAAHVRELAGEAQAAARQIRLLISASKGRADAGATVVDDALQAINQLVSSVNQTTTVLDQIGRSLADQVQGIDQISFAMREIDARTTNGVKHIQDSVVNVAQVCEVARDLAQAAARLNGRSLPATEVPSRWAPGIAMA